MSRVLSRTGERHGKTNNTNVRSRGLEILDAARPHTRPAPRGVADQASDVEWAGDPARRTRRPPTTRNDSMASEPSEEDIRMRAYQRYLERGGQTAWTSTTGWRRSGS